MNSAQTHTHVQKRKSDKNRKIEKWKIQVSYERRKWKTCSLAELSLNGDNVDDDNDDGSQQPSINTVQTLPKRGMNRKKTRRRTIHSMTKSDVIFGTLLK